MDAKDWAIAVDEIETEGAVVLRGADPYVSIELFRQALEGQLSKAGLAVCQPNKTSCEQEYRITARLAHVDLGNCESRWVIGPILTTLFRKHSVLKVEGLVRQGGTPIGRYSAIGIDVFRWNPNSVVEACSRGAARHASDQILRLMKGA